MAGGERAERLERRLERRGVLLGHQPVDVARHLPDLRRQAAQVPEHLGRVLGGAPASAVDQHAGAGAHADGSQPREAAQARLGDAAVFSHGRGRAACLEPNGQAGKVR